MSKVPEQFKDPTVRQVAKKMMEAAPPKPAMSEQNPLAGIDHPTLFAATAVVNQVGFKHFTLSRDTRQSLEARKAHRFVSMACEDACRKILRLSGAPPNAVEEALVTINRTTAEFEKNRNEAAGNHPPKMEKIQ